MKIGPRAPGTNRRSTPASRTRRSSVDAAASSSATTSAPTRKPEPRERERRVRRPAAEPPAARVVVHEIATGRAHDDDLRRSRPSGPCHTGDTLARATPPILGIMHFYELHEGDDDVFADLLLVRDEEMEPEEFFELVQSIRRRVIEGFEQSTLVEAIADELERDYGFIAVTDERLTAAVNVSRDEEENFLADLDAPRGVAGLRVDPRRPPGRGRPPELRRPSREPSASAAEQDLDHVAVAHPVGLALRADLAVLLRLGDGPEGQQVLVRDRLRADEARARSVWIAPAASTAFDPSGIGQARTSSGPAVRNEIRPTSR